MAKIFKRCIRCQKLYEGKACPDCSKRLAVKNAQKRQAEDEGRKLYSSYRWEQCRKNVRLKYMDIDIWLLAEGQVYRCEQPFVHHIVERDDVNGYDLIYDIDNLIVVCKESHEAIHQWYKRDRAYALDRIARGKDAFERMFGNEC